MKFVVQGELPDLNTIIAEAKRGRGKYQPYNDLKQAWTNAVAWSCKGAGKFTKVDLIITWYCKDKRKDKDNVSVGIKFILDGLVKAGVIENDGWEQVGNFTHRWEIDRKNPRVEVELKEVGI